MALVDDGDDDGGGGVDCDKMLWSGVDCDDGSAIVSCGTFGAAGTTTMGGNLETDATAAGSVGTAAAVAVGAESTGGKVGAGESLAAVVCGCDSAGPVAIGTVGDGTATIPGVDNKIISNRSICSVWPHCADFAGSDGTGAGGDVTTTGVGTDEKWRWKFSRSRSKSSDDGTGVTDGSGNGEDNATAVLLWCSGIELEPDEELLVITLVGASLSWRCSGLSGAG